MNTNETQAGEDKVREREIRRIVLLGVAGVAGWFGLFGLGLFIDSAIYRKPLVDAGYNLHPFCMSLLTFTPTNVGMLCLMAAFVGGCTSRLQNRWADRRRAADMAGVSATPAGDFLAGSVPPPPAAAQPEAESESDLFRKENPVASMLRGFVVYGGYMAGSFIATDKPFSETTPEMYARVAGVTSLAAFTVGFDPTFIYGLIGLKGRTAPSGQ